jgi:hypothetical protein
MDRFAANCSQTNDCEDFSTQNVSERLISENPGKLASDGGVEV